MLFQIQVAAISMFLISRNAYANGFLATQLGIWLFATKAHIDIKQVFCRIGFSISDMAIQNYLNSLGKSNIENVRQSLAACVTQGDFGWRCVIDNEQQMIQVYKHGIGRANELCVGCGGMVIRLDDYKPGAFLLEPLINARIRNDCQGMTVESLCKDIDWLHLQRIAVLHTVHTLCEYIPQLHDLLPQISSCFREPPVGKHRMRSK